MTWMLTSQGESVDLRFIAQDTIHVDDIAESIAKINRFTGHSVRLYSVAEHSLLVSQIMERRMGIRSPAALLAGLMHDAHEAYCGDMSSPMKQLLGQAWAEEEARIQWNVLRRFGLTTAFAAFRDSIHQADRVALATERRDLMHPGGPTWGSIANVEPLDDMNLTAQAGFDWTDWRLAFLDRFEELQHARAEQAKRL